MVNYYTYLHFYSLSLYQKMCICILPLNTGMETILKKYSSSFTHLFCHDINDLGPRGISFRVLQIFFRGFTNNHCQCVYYLTELLREMENLEIHKNS